MSPLPFGEDVDIADADKLILVRLKAFDLDHFRRKILHVRETTREVTTTTEQRHKRRGRTCQSGRSGSVRQNSSTAKSSCPLKGARTSVCSVRP